MMEQQKHRSEELDALIDYLNWDVGLFEAIARELVVEVALLDTDPQILIKILIPQLHKEYVAEQAQCQQVPNQ